MLARLHVTAAAGSERTINELQNPAPPVPPVPTALPELAPSPPIVELRPRARNVEKTGNITVAAERDATGRWVSGTPSPNPRGRPRQDSPEVSELARDYTEAAILKLAEIMQNPKASPAVQAAAATALLDRGHGRPTTNLNARVASVDLGKLHLDALRELSSANR